MYFEIGLIVTASICLIVYFVASKNKREKIDLHGKHCLITGGSSGIGWELCIEAFKQGAHVSIIARNKVIEIYIFSLYFKFIFNIV
jgi:NADP-dependent 3-hydroxy acid dehydrogenase YdfG